MLFYFIRLRGGRYFNLRARESVCLSFTRGANGVMESLVYFLCFIFFFTVLFSSSHSLCFSLFLPPYLSIYLSAPPLSLFSVSFPLFPSTKGSDPRQGIAVVTRSYYEGYLCRLREQKTIVIGGDKRANAIFRVFYDEDPRLSLAASLPHYVFFPFYANIMSSSSGLAGGQARDVLGWRLQTVGCVCIYSFLYFAFLCFLWRC